MVGPGRSPSRGSDAPGSLPGEALNALDLCRAKVRAAHSALATPLQERDKYRSVAAVHRSRLVGILIDTPAARVDEAVEFWLAALGAQPYPAPGEEQFTALIGATPGLFTVVQAVDDAPRYHLDIETDDLQAEVARLIALGAELVTRWKDAFTLRAPGGHLLCVVPVHSDPETFTSSARTWS